MAAYAALTSLMHIVEQIRHHPYPPITIEKQHIESLCKNVSFLQDFLETYSHKGGCKEVLESQIADAAYAAEDIIETHIVDHILARSPSRKTKQILNRDGERSSSNLFCQDLNKVIEDMNLIKKEAIQIQGKIRDDQLPRNIISTSANVIGSSALPPPTRNNTNTMVGFDDVSIQIMDMLTGLPSKRQVLAVSVDWYLNSVFPSSMHLLWNLQTLIIKGDQSRRGIIKVPPKIWRMSRLRHLEIDSWFSLPDPPIVPLIHEGDGDDFILRNLQTLKRVRNFNLSEEMVKRIPNIKKLRVGYLDYRWWHNLGLLNKLESLYIDYSLGSDPSFRIEFLQNIAFPHSIKKLTLCGTYFLWKDMRMIGSLPHLQVLKLSYGSFRGSEWNPVEEEFLCLKFLLIEGCDHLVYWKAEPTHFPRLEQLVLKFLPNLKEIPWDLGQISTLRSIEVWDCKNSLVMSAKKILDEQVEAGNEGYLQVRVNGKPQFSS